MRIGNRLGVLVIAVVASLAGLGATAMAAELLENLPEVKRSAVSESIGTITYVNLGETLRFECASVTGTGEETVSKPPEGTFHVTIKGCKTTISGLTVKCTGLGDATAGEILLLGTWKLVFDRNPLTESLTTALLFNVEPTHFVCGGFALVVTEGTELCLHLNPLALAPTHEFHCIVLKGGDREDKQYWLADGSGPLSPTLTQKIGTGSAEDVDWLMLGKVTTTEAIFADQ